MRPNNRPLFIVVISLMLLSGIGFALQTVSSCQVISTSDSYELDSGLSGAPISNPGEFAGSSSCILINASNVVLDCKNFSIMNNGTNGSTYGVLSYSNNNVTVKNCYLGNYTYGISFYQSDNGAILNNVVEAGSFLAILLNASSYNNVSNNNITGTYGIMLQEGSNGNLLVRNNITDGTIGIDIENGSDNTVQFNYLRFNELYGIYASFADRTIFNGNNVSFSGLGNYVYASADCVFTDNDFFLNSFTGLYLESVERCLIDRNSISQTQSNGGEVTGLYLLYSNNNVIINNHFDENHGYSTVIGGNGGSATGLYLVTSDNNSIINNTANSNRGDSGTRGRFGGSGGFGRGITISDSDNIILVNNTADSNSGGTGGQGILIGPLPLMNIPSDSDRGPPLGGVGGTGGMGSGIYIESSTNVLMEKNNASSNSGGPGGPGVNRGGSGGSGFGLIISSCSENIAQDNNLLSNRGGWGGSGGGGDRSPLSSEELPGPVLGGSGGSGFGLYMDSSNDNTIHGNRADDNSGGPASDDLLGQQGSGFGMYFTYSYDNTIDENTMIFNYGPRRLLLNTGYGLYLYGCYDNSFSSNEIANNTYGIYILSYGSGDDSYGNTFYLDVVHDNRGTGFYESAYPGASTLTNIWLYNNALEISQYSYDALFIVDHVKLGENSVYFSLNDTIFSGYDINETVSPGPRPEGYSSFRNTYLWIQDYGEDKIDSLSFNRVNEYVESFTWNSSLNWTLTPNQAIINDFRHTILMISDLVPSEPYGADIHGLFTTRSSSDGDGGNPELSASISPSCGDHTITVTSGSSPVEGASVSVDNEIFLSTNSLGQATFNLPCGQDVDVSISKSGYRPYGPTQFSLSCGPCTACSRDSDCAFGQECLDGECAEVAPECSSDSDCPQTQMCQQGSCIPKPECTDNSQCPSGEICSLGSCQQPVPECSADSDCDLAEICENGKCVSAGCASSSDCLDNQECRAGTCVQITGCGQVSNHMFVPYECGTEFGCPSCPSGYSCESNTCISYGIDCPLSGVVGQSIKCSFSRQGEPCMACDIVVTGPDGTPSSYKTDQSGNLIVPLAQSGSYQVSLVQGGTKASSVAVQASMGSEPAPEEGNSSGFALGGIMLLALLLIIGLAIAIYWLYLRKK